MTTTLFLRDDSGAAHQNRLQKTLPEKEIPEEMSRRTVGTDRRSVCFMLLISIFVLSGLRAGAEKSWVDLERYSGERGSRATTQGDYRQLIYELQAEQESTADVESARRSLSSVAPTTAYHQLTLPRNNERARHALSVLHWTRKVESDSSSQLQTLDEAEVRASSSTNVTVFAFAPVRSTTYRGAELELSIDEDDLFEVVESNDQQIVYMQLDTGDGSGPQEVDVGEFVTASYTTTGEKTLVLEATLADGSELQATTTLEVAALSTPDPTEIVELQAASPYSDHTGSIYILKSGNHAGIRCPVLVVEGFDMNNTMDWDVLYNILNKEQLAEDLASYGRDLVVLDFDDATADIFGNAQLAIKAIQYINANRNDSNDKFTVIGASMGGLVSRRALAACDKYPFSFGASDVDTWISFDSPQTGANIPLGLQEFFDFFGDFTDDYSQLAMVDDFKDKLDSDAAKEMLLCHYSSSGTPAGSSSRSAWFWDSMESYGYPTSCKRVAICNGSGYGEKQPYAPGEQIIYWHADDGITLEIGCKIYALDASDSTSQTLFYGVFDPWDWFDLIDEREYRYSYYKYALDNASGGTRDSFQELFDSLPSAYKSSDDWCLYPNHCFIPTTSALGIPLSGIEETVDGNSALLSQSPFDEIHYAITNETHIDINTRNKRWFMRAILEEHDTDGDGFDDYAEYVVGTAYDSTADSLAADLNLTLKPPFNAPQLEWKGRANAKYTVYFSESLSGTWEVIDTMSPESQSQVSMVYPYLMDTTNGFFRIAVEPVDPVSD
jgi:hypothetical protein